MIRRKFLGLMTMAGAAGGIAAASKTAGAEKQTVVFKVNGFTCITCAVGLETLLLRERGILAAHATYPAGRATVMFDPKAIALDRITDVIQEMGFVPELVQAT